MYELNPAWLSRVFSVLPAYIQAVWPTGIPDLEARRQMDIKQDENTHQPAVTDAFRTRVLLIDAEPSTLRHLRILLRAENFLVHEALSGQAGLDIIDAIQPDLVLIGLPLPDIDGAQLVKDLHDHRLVPVLVLSDMDVAASKIAVLDAGAEDYILRPFSVAELLARLRVALRRVRIVERADVFSSANLVVDFVHRRVTLNGQLVNLTPTEYALLRVLIAHADKPVTHDQLCEAIHGRSEKIEAHTLRVHLSNLRRKLGGASPSDPKHILTEVGIGYRLQTHASSGSP